MGMKSPSSPLATTTRPGESAPMGLPCAAPLSACEGRRSFAGWRAGSWLGGPWLGGPWLGGPWLGLLLFLSSACSKSEATSSPAGGSAGDAGQGAGSGAGGALSVSSIVPRRRVLLEASDEILRNPERGFYRYVDALSEQDLSWVDDEVSLYFTYIRLDDYRQTPIADGFLEELDSALSRAQGEGVKWIVRFAYNFGPYPDSEPDASLPQVLQHIEQLEPLLRSHASLIATVQAGFIGAWGEWHSSTNGIDDIEDKETVLHALLDAVPEERTVQVRYPADLMSLYGERPRSLSQSFDGSHWARTAHHNDCFLAGPRDTGTYPAPTEPEVYKQYLEQHNLSTPMGGESCALSAPRTGCVTALEEMERLRFSFINADYHPDVVSGWSEGGCREEMERSLGYRLVVEQVDVPESVAAGDPLQIVLSLKNVGWAAPMNARPLRLVLTDPSASEGGTRHHVEAEAEEVRAWLPGSTTHLRFAFSLPESWSSERVQIGLWLPDADEALARDARYSIRLAQEGWDSERGVHQLVEIPVDSEAPRDEVAALLPLERGP